MQVLASRPTREDAQALLHSTDPLTVKRAAVAFAKSQDPEDHETLFRFLADGLSLERLDSAEDYQRTYRDLRLSTVLRALMENQAPSAGQLLIRLIDVEHFHADVLRRQIEVRALAAVRPSPPQAIAYWDRLSQPGSPIAYDVIQALCINQSSGAMVLLEHKLADGRFDSRNRIDWMHLLVLPRRNEEAILQCCERLLLGSWEAPLQTALLETVFDYRPEEWHIGDDPPVPPLLVEATDAARETLRRIGRHALDELAPPPQLRGKIEATLAGMGA